MQQITVSDLRQRLSTTTLSLIDVRPSEAFHQNHLSQAVSIPLETLPAQLHSLSKQETHYIICTKGIRSMQACELLEKEGFSVINVTDGMNGLSS